MTSGRILGVGAILFVALFVITALVAPGRVEDQLQRDAAAALSAHDLAPVAVDADGRSLIVPDGTDEAVLVALQGVEGVRDVRFAEVESATPVSTPPSSTSSTPSTSLQAPLPTTSLAPPSTRATTTSTTTSTVPPTFEDELLAALGTVEFEPDHPDEPTALTKAKLDDVAQLLASRPEARISVVGHVAEGSATGGDDDALSLARAWAVAGYLEWRGISFGRIDVSGAGASSPLPGLDPDDSSNERIDIRVLQGA